MQPPEGDFSSQLQQYVNDRKRYREDNDAPICNDFSQYAPSGKCKCGKDCREIVVCSYYHGDISSLETQFCSCVDVKCPKTNPNRARKWLGAKSIMVREVLSSLYARNVMDHIVLLSALVWGALWRDAARWVLCFPLSSGPGANCFASFSALHCRCRRISMLSWAGGGRATA